MIRFGPAGIPLSCKGRTLRDGIEDVHNLSLTALEIQMVRSGTIVAYPDEDDVGVMMKDLEGRLIVEIERDGKLITDPKTKIKEDDTLIQMTAALTNNFNEVFDIGEYAKTVDVDVSIHTPNYMDLGSNTPLTDDCINSIRHAALIENALGGNIVVTNLGLYNGIDNESDLDDNIYANVKALMKWWKTKKLTPKLGVEITAQDEVFGSLEQILDMCDEIKGLVPVINWPQYYVRASGSLIDQEDFQYVLDQVEPYCTDCHIHTLFAGVEAPDMPNYRLTPIKKGDLKFDTLAECLVETKPDMTIISASPLLEHDAMYMRVIHERYLSKKVAKSIRARKKEEEEDAKENSDEEEEL